MRLLTAAAGALFGAVVALTSVPAHRHGSWVGGVVLPWGLLVALAAALGCGLALRGQGLATVGFSVGWVVVLLALMPGGPGGDYVFINDLRGWGLLGGGVAVGAVLLALGLGGRDEAG